MLDLFKELDFSRELEQNQELRLFLIDACKKIEQEDIDHLRKIRKPELDDELMNQFIVSGLPSIKIEQQEKFVKLFKDKLLAGRNIGQKHGLVELTVGIEGANSNGTLYLTYQTIPQAKTAYSKLNNLKFDPTHPMSCVWVNEIRTLIEEEDQSIPTDFTEPQNPSSKSLREHNIDEQFRNQFLVREDKTVYLQWLDHLDKSAKSALEGSCQQLGYNVNKAVFSPKGSYLAVCCHEGVHLYYSNSLKHKGLLRHTNPIDAKFSPDERFLVSSNGPTSKNRENFIIWAVEQQVKLKAYRAHSNQTLECFQFSQDGLNLSVALQHEVSLFRTSSVDDLLKQIKAPEEEQHTIKAPYIQKMVWLKQRDELLVMCYERDYNPMSASATRIFLYNVESRRERKWRAWSEHAKNGEVFVSEKGEWVAIALKKFMKKGHFTTAVQICSLLKREQNLSISSIEFKEEVGNISFDSINNRMAIIYKDESIKSSINLRFIVSFYEISTKNKTLEVHKIGQIPNNLQNRVVLSNNGAFFALYNITEESAEKGRFSLGIISKENKDKKKGLSFQFSKQSLMVNGMTFFEVDPSGRFILLGTERGYQVWNFIGQIVMKDTLQKTIHDVQWRPRLLNRLSEEEERVLFQQQKDIRKKYQKIDDMRINALFYQKQAAMLKQKEQFKLFAARKQEWYKGFLAAREKILGFKENQARTDKYVVEEGFIDLQ